VTLFSSKEVGPGPPRTAGDSTISLDDCHCGSSFRSSTFRLSNVWPFHREILRLTDFSSGFSSRCGKRFFTRAPPSQAPSSVPRAATTLIQRRDACGLPAFWFFPPGSAVTAFSVSPFVAARRVPLSRTNVYSGGACACLSLFPSESTQQGLLALRRPKPWYPVC